MDILSRSQEMPPVLAYGGDGQPTNGDALYLTRSHELVLSVDANDDGDAHSPLELANTLPLLTSVIEEAHHDDADDDDVSEDSASECDTEPAAAAASAASSSPTTAVASPVATSTLPDFECPICLETTNEYSQFSCRHSYCHACIAQLVKTTLETGSNNYHIACPDCHAINTYRSALTHLEPEMLERLHSLCARANENVELVRCWCPRKSCGAELIVDDNQRRPRCTACGHSFCGVCLEVHSRFAPCTAAELAKCIASPRARGASQVRKYLTTKPCPQCGSPIEKNGGCHHMSCSHCHAYFCWRCGHDLNKGGMHCWGLVVAAVAVGVPAAVITAPVWLPVLGIGYVGYRYHRHRRQRRYR